jgi:NhaA family Na+:H+ antiporter
MRLNSLVRFDEQYTRTDAERVSERMLRPFHQFARWQASGALLLLVCAVAALVWANSPWATAYGQMLHAPLSLSLSERVLQLDLRHWINDGLMAIFFFAVGLEIKRELIVGELADRRKAMLPIAAAIGGMVVPALCYAAANIGGEGARGWGIPMATDIAFALGALAVLGSRIPEGLKVFLVALAIVDDLGALLVIAVVYTAAINWNGLALAAVFSERCSWRTARVPVRRRYISRLASARGTGYSSLACMPRWLACWRRCSSRRAQGLCPAQWRP